jgi:carbonic anhydrase
LKLEFLFRPLFQNSRSMPARIVFASSAVPPPPPPKRPSPPPSRNPDVSPIPSSNNSTAAQEIDRRRALLGAAFSALAMDDQYRAAAFAATASTSTSSSSPTSSLSPRAPPAGWSYSKKAKDWSSLGFDGCGVTGQQSPINLSPPFMRIKEGGGGASAAGSSSSSSSSSSQRQQPKFLELSADYRAASFDVVVERGLTASPKFTVVGASGRDAKKEKGTTRERRHPAGGIYLLDSEKDGGKVFYPLVQFHFHRPGEEALEGKRGVLGAHLVHQRDEDSASNSSASSSSFSSPPSPSSSSNLPRFVVVAVAFDLSRGSPDPALDDLLVENEQIKEEEGAPWRRVESFDPLRLLPGSLVTSSSSSLSSSSEKKLKNFFAFEGSLTTPPCTKGARFYFAKGRKAATAEQVARGVLPKGAENARPLQERGGRVVWEG